MRQASIAAMKGSWDAQRTTVAVMILCAGFIALSFFRSGSRGGTCALLPFEPKRLSLASLGDWQLVDLEGRSHPVTTGPDEVKLVSIWATWCVNCRSEMPELNALKRTFGPRGLSVETINLDQASPEKLTALAQSLGIEVPVLRPTDETRETLMATVRAVPTTLVLGPDSTILATIEGALDPAQIEALVAPYLTPSVEETAPRG